MSKLRLLIVDDDLEDAHENWGGPLGEDFHWSVDYAGGYREALAALKRKPPDVVILDRRMPHPETGELRQEVGDELLKQVVAQHPDVCAIMLTHNADVQSAKVDTRRGAYEYFDKQIENKILDQACRNGMKWTRIKRSRREFIALQSEEEVFQAAVRAARLDGEAYCFGYVELTPQGSLVLDFADCPGLDSERVAVHTRRRFLATSSQDRQILDEIVAGRQARLVEPGDLSSESSLSGDPAIRLLVPVIAAAGERAGQVIGLLWFEGTRDDSFVHSDVTMFEILANHVAEALQRIRVTTEARQEASRDARQSIVAETARSIADPLQSAQTDLELLLSDFQSPADDGRTQRVTEALHSLEQSVQATIDLGSDLPPQQTEPEVIDFARLVKLRAEAIRPRAEAEGCEIIPAPGDWPDFTAPVRLDPASMQYALDCVLENAIEAIAAWRTSHPGRDRSGQIVVRLSRDPLQRSVLVSIVDTGTGIAAAHLPRLFERDFTTKEAAVRDGKRSLGLYMVRRHVETWGGTVEAWNAPKGGAEFTILFPLAGP